MRKLYRWKYEVVLNIRGVGLFNTDYLECVVYEDEYDIEFPVTRFVNYHGNILYNSRKSEHVSATLWVDFDDWIKADKYHVLFSPWSDFEILEIAELDD